MRLGTHHKLFLSYTLLVGAVVLILVVGVDATLREPLLDRARVDLLRELAQGRDLYDARPTETPDAIARRMREAVGHRVTIIAPDGSVLGESDVPPDMVPHLDALIRSDAAAARAVRERDDQVDALLDSLSRVLLTHMKGNNVTRRARTRRRPRSGTRWGTGAFSESAAARPADSRSETAQVVHPAITTKSLD
jgi:hypothetical protein